MLICWFSTTLCSLPPFSAGIAISAIVQFFGVTYQGVTLDWWGNGVVSMGCEDHDCVLKMLPEGEYFGPAPGEL